MSPRMAKTIDVVTSEMQLATNSFPLCIDPPVGVAAPLDFAQGAVSSVEPRQLTKSRCLLHAELDRGYTVPANACRTASLAECVVVSTSFRLGGDHLDRRL